MHRRLQHNGYYVVIIDKQICCIWSKKLNSPKKWHNKKTFPKETFEKV